MTQQLYLSKSERRALTVLFTCAIFYQIYALSLYHGESKFTKQEEFIVKKLQIQDTLIVPKSEGKAINLKEEKTTDIPHITGIKDSSGSKRIKEHTRTESDPNKMDSLDWLSINLHPKSIKTIMNYKRKGGRFYKKEDLLKIYNIDSNWVEKNASLFHFGKSAFSKEIININLADTTDLKKLRGIGPSFANRIVKYRKNLGGFHSIKQILEVYGMDEKIIEKNKGRIVVNGPIRKIRINEVDNRELGKHFYFDWKIANSITRYIHHHGPIVDTSDLYNLHSVDSMLVKKWLPYLDFSINKSSEK